MPKDFSTPVSQKVSDDLATNKLVFKTKAEAQNYLKKIHENLDEILYSGFIVYGDEVSMYVSQVAAELLKDKPELMKELRFYTIKSNEVNAFSTAPGIIFVTTGLIAQLSSEAQLAYILCHEIAHYELKHVHDEYLNNQKTGNLITREQIAAHSQFSKENELEADKLALKRYNKSGYSTEELIGTLDVLMYSYLPFDEIPFPKDYFNNGNLYIPLENLHLYTIPITAEEDYDDKYSTHPNIKKRKDAILKSIPEFENWGNLSFILDVNKFKYIRTVCRFESVRTNVIEGNDFSALYDIFLLERDYPESEYLNRMKALTWLSIIRLNDDFEKNKSGLHIEGESSYLYRFLASCTRFDRSTMGLRIIYDLKHKYSDNPFFETIYNFCIDEISTDNLLNPSNFKSVNYQTASANNEKQSLSTPSSSDDSKYNRIKTKRSTVKLALLDVTEYLTYAIPDIIQDSNFLFRYGNMKKQNDSVYEAKKWFNSLSKRAQDKVLNEKLKQLSTIKPANKKLIFIEPKIEVVAKRPEREKGLLATEKDYHDLILKNAENQGFEPILITRDSLKTQSTDEFNEYNIYMNYLEQSGQANRGKKVLSTNPELLNKYQEKRNTSNLIFTRVVDYSYFNNDIASGSLIIHSIPYAYFIYSPRLIYRSRSLFLFSIVLNCKTGKSFSYEQDDLSKSLDPANYMPHYKNLFKLIRTF